MAILRLPFKVAREKVPQFVFIDLRASLKGVAYLLIHSFIHSGTRQSAGQQVQGC